MLSFFKRLPEQSSLPKPSKVQAQQIGTISKQWLESKQVRKLESSLMQSVDKRIKLHIAL
ncbi:MAG: type II toxin-antitoxin system PemK/MazF family toxin [Cyanobacteriota bacterium]